jgi:NAD(P)-dependent dehydrogenase (short-subunit alcohol dehydrogenase family)
MTIPSLPKELSFEGKRVLVCGGGGSGIGSHVVEILSRLGAEIHVFDLQEPRTEVASYRSVDLSDPGAGIAAVGAIGQPIDVLINAQGLFKEGLAVQVVRVNFIGLRAVADKVLESMPAGGSVVSIATQLPPLPSDLSGMRTFIDLPHSAAIEYCERHPEEIGDGYGFSKFRLALWSLDTALAHAKRGVRVNLVYPGRTDSPLLNNFIRDDGPMARQRQASGHIELVSRVIGRVAHAREVAWPVVFLASDAASYITGARLPVEGGFLTAAELGRL